jgi:LysM repeat protein
MKRLFIILLALPSFVTAQNKPLAIEGTAPGFFITHIVAPKENYYSVGRLYNASPKEIAPFNKLELEKGLSLNQSIKIPLTAVNFTQANDAGTDEVLVPVYHTVKEKEGLYHIGTIYNKLPLNTLKQWNNIKGDAVGKGTQLIVGYLKVKKELSAFSGKAKSLPAVAVSTTPKEIVKPDVTAEPLPPVKNPVKEKPVAVVTKTNPVAPAVVAPIKKEPLVVAKETVKADTKTVSVKNFSKAFFKPDFDKQTQQHNISTETGTAAVFKSTSGWEDGKYYCLHNTATPGTIIKITSKTTGKYVFAKVLDMMPDIKQNTDLLIRLSNAAAEELGVGETKFDCSLSFSK